MKILIIMLMSVIAICCGGASKEPSAKVVSVEDYESTTFTVEAKEGSVEGLLGNVTDDELERVFGDNKRRLLKCYEDAVYDLEEIEGSLRFELEVESTGEVSRAYISSSDLGSLETEECMLRHVRGFRFNRAPGGVAVISYPLELVPPYEHDPFVEWPRDRIAPVVSEHESEIAGCMNGSSGAAVTMYIGKGGTVLSSGASAGDADAFEAASCVARAARGWRFGDPGDRLVKAVVEL